MSSPQSPIFVAGDPQPSGAYLLRIRLRSACDVCFGRFNHGAPLHLPAGEFSYVGSAMGQKGSATLKNRLLRHARRSGNRQPHLIYADLQACFLAMGWLDGTSSTPRGKQLRWHIDYLIDHAAAELIQIFIFCSETRIEAQIADHLLADPATRIVAPGLGASDSPGSTHLIQVVGSEAWWQRMREWTADLADPR